MSEYTPTTEQVREAWWAAQSGGVDPDFDDRYYPQFDRWKAQNDADVRKQVGKEITEAIESKYLGPDSGRLPDGRDAPDAAQRNAYDEGLEVAARIAHQASRGIGGGA